MAEDTKGQRICRIYDNGKQDRANFDRRIELFAPYFDPTRAGITRRFAPGQAVMSDVYDGEGIYAADLCAKFVGGNLHSAGSRWFSLMDERGEVNADDDAREWLEECRDRMLLDLATSNFYAEAYEADKDWSCFGGGLFHVDEADDDAGESRTRFTAYKVGRYIVQEGMLHQVNARYIEFELDAFAAKEKFGDVVMQESPDDMGIASAIRNANHVTKWKFIHAIYPRGQETGDRGYKQKLPWASCYVEYKTKKVVQETGYEEFPDMAPRWSRIPGEVYGRGLAEIAYNDAVTLSTLKRKELEGLAQTVLPSIAVKEKSVIGTLRLTPGAPITVKTPGSIRDAIQRLDIAGNFQAANLKEEQLRDSIDKAFYVKQLQQLMQLEGQSEMRVYVFAQKLNLTFKILGPIYGRWESEFGVPYVRRHFNLLYRRGAFSRPPDILLEQGGRIKVQFESPLARAQRMEEIEAIQQTMQNVLPWAEAQFKLTGQYPTIMDNYDWDQLAQITNILYAFPAKASHSPKEIAVIRQSRAQAEQQQAQQQQMQGLTESAKNVAPFIQALNQPKAA